jgi:hypothetical protein
MIGTLHQDHGKNSFTATHPGRGDTRCHGVAFNILSAIFAKNIYCYVCAKPTRNYLSESQSKAATLVLNSEKSPCCRLKVHVNGMTNDWLYDVLGTFTVARAIKRENPAKANLKDTITS